MPCSVDAGPAVRLDLVEARCSLVAWQQVCVYVTNSCLETCCCMAALGCKKFLKELLCLRR